jgi:hypothetical protein
MTSIAELAAELARAVPQFSAGAIALVDSPRSPINLKVSLAVSRNGFVPRPPHLGGRAIDSALRRLIAHLRAGDARPALTPLSLFPTPPIAHFAGHLRAPGCKPHLAAFGAEMFGRLLGNDSGAPAGAIFTRFMLAGFATHRALTICGAAAWESYPDLAFRLWSRVARLPPKSQRAAAIGARRRTIRHLGRVLGCGGCGTINRYDALDAAALALTVAAAKRRGAVLTIADAAEGRFMIGLDAREARILGLGG